MSTKPAQQIYTGRALGASSPEHDDVGSGDGILMGSSSKGLTADLQNKNAAGPFTDLRHSIWATEGYSASPVTPPPLF